MNEEEFSKTNNGLVAIKFWAKWCAVCYRIDPIWKKMQEEFGDIFQFSEINTDESKDIVAKFNIKSLPTVLLLNNGKEVKRIVGAVLTEPFRKVFKDVISSEIIISENE